MAVGTAKEVTGQLMDEGTNTFEHARIFQVVTSSSSDNDNSVLSASGLPGRGDAHPSGNGAVCVRRRVRQREQLGDGGSVYLVTCEYSTAPPTERPEDTPGNPLSFRPKYRWTIDFNEKPIETAYFLGIAEGDNINEALGGFERAITNAAGQPFQTVYTEQEPVLGLEVVRNEAAYDPLTALDWIQTTNSSPVTFFGKTFDTQTALLENWTAEPQFDQDGAETHQSVHYQFKFDLGKHYLRVLNAGTMELDGNGDLVLIKDTNKHIVTEPVLLDAAGQQKLTPLNADHPAYYMVWRPKGQQDFNSLGLPTS